MNKADIYKKIKAFNEAPFLENRPNSDPRHKAYFYVPEEIAADRAEFLKFILSNDPVLKEKKFSLPQILDLAFGSGSLTTHLVLENFPEHLEIVFNDKNQENTFQKVGDLLEDAKVTSKDFLQSYSFDLFLKSDIIIFNPQIGGGYIDGDSGLSDSVEAIIFEGSLESYFRTNGLPTRNLFFHENAEERKIEVSTDELSKKELSEIMKGITNFNYHDVFYQSKTSKKEGSVSNNVKFRRTFDKVFNSDGLFIFYGTSNAFNALFADFVKFGYVAEYRTKDIGNNLFVALKSVDNPEKRCYKRSKDGKSFVEIPNCEEEDEGLEIEGNLEDLELEIGKMMLELGVDDGKIPLIKQEEKMSEEIFDETNPFEFNIPENPHHFDFSFKNVLLKGVPGTGKSRLINESFIKKRLKLAINAPNILRVNVHSASSNADLMQGIGINSNEGKIEYKEKMGLILKHLRTAIQSPYEPFVIVLEEIQENSLNELIGDLIYLIEADKRVNLQEKLDNQSIQPSYKNEEAFFEDLCSGEGVYFVEMPYLVATKRATKKMILPDNLYIFCTSNYRDDKKVIEDNLLRRFEVIEIYPKNKNIIGDAFENEEVSNFLDSLNQAILTEFREKEIHPDRFMIGHAIWLQVNDAAAFCRAMLKVITEFKDVKEIEFSEFREILKRLTPPDFDSLEKGILKGEDYQTIIQKLQKIAYSNLLNV